MFKNKEEMREQIRQSYESVALKGETSCGCGCGQDDSENNPLNLKMLSINNGYVESDLIGIPNAANMGLGCGNPIAMAAIKPGETVLDLGSGGGFDCFLARRQVGETGFVIGVDMTAAMIKLSRKNAEESGYSNMEFRLGEIEHLPVADGSVDVIISNCVINLSLDKEQVFSEAYRVLKPGGRLSISDIVATAELPQELKLDLSMLTGCVSGAEYIHHLENMLHAVGFVNVRMYPKDNSRQLLSTWAPGRNIEEYVASFIIEATKME